MGEFEKRKFLIYRPVKEPLCYLDIGTPIRMREEGKFFEVRPLPKDLVFVPWSVIEEAKKEFEAVRRQVDLPLQTRVNLIVALWIRWFGDG